MSLWNINVSHFSTRVGISNLTTWTRSIVATSEKVILYMHFVFSTASSWPARLCKIRYNKTPAQAFTPPASNEIWRGSQTQRRGSWRGVPIAISQPRFWINPGVWKHKSHRFIVSVLKIRLNFAISWVLFKECITWSSQVAARGLGRVCRPRTNFFFISFFFHSKHCERVKNHEQSLKFVDYDNKITWWYLSSLCSVMGLSSWLLAFFFAILRFIFSLGSLPIYSSW